VQAQEDQWLAAFALDCQGELLQSGGDQIAAAARFGEALALFRAGAPREAASVGQNLAVSLLWQGRASEAAALVRESVGILRAQGTRWYLPECLEVLAGAEAAAGRAERAARLFGAAEATRELAGATRFATYQADVERRIAATRAALGEAGFAAAWAAGRAWGVERAIEEALVEVPQIPPVAASAADAPHQPDGVAGLTPREAEVLRLVVA